MERGLVRHVRVGDAITTAAPYPVYPPQLSGGRSEQRAALLSNPPPTVHWRGRPMEEWDSVLMGDGKETATLRKISSPPDVVAGPRAIMKRRMR